MPFVAVVVDTPLTKVFHYRVPDAFADVRAGDRVLVPFGPQRLRGVVVGRSDDCPIDEARVKDILSVSAPGERLPADLLDLTRWAAEYYFSSWGATLAAALPASVRADRGGAVRKHAALLIAPDDADREAATLRRAPRQAALLRALAQRTRECGGMAFALTDLTFDGEAVDPAAAKPLEKRGWIALSDARARAAADRVDPAAFAPGAAAPPEPTPAQAAALARIEGALDTRAYHAFLLHGVTGSGKTEVYLRALAHTLAQGRTALVLVPEISLTPQTVARFRARAPAPVAVLHSHMAGGHRADEWRRIANGEARVVVGARSAVFAPLADLGLVVVDEEHERTYKQDNDPRYHGRDVAVVRAARAGAVVLLGSATPSLESWRNAQTGKYECLSLPDRPGASKPAAVSVVDLRREWAELKKPAVISRELESALKRALARGEQSILFLNRRGFHTTVRCEACGDVLQCEHCDIPLTFHRAHHRLRCHYCGLDADVPSTCPACGHAALKFVGTGVERVEDILAQILPEARTLRMDADTMAGAGAHEEALARFGRGGADILLGTQMVAKGLDFPNVTVVGVLQADAALTLPEFRAAERTFQLVTQVAGRAGRADKPGRAIVQAFQPEHHAIQAALAQDYAAFVRDEAPDREGLGYPPYGRLARVLLRGPNEQKTAAAAEALAEALRAATPSDGKTALLGPAPCFLARVQGEFRVHLLLKADTHRTLSTWLRAGGAANGEYSGVRTGVDVDPQTLL